MAKNYDIKEINQRFGQLFKRFGMSQAEFGFLLGISQNHVSNILLGKSGVTPMLIKILELQANINPRWLKHGELPVNKENPEWTVYDVPVIADIPAGDWKFWIDSYITGAGISYISCPDLKGDNLFAIRVEGDSMEPMINKKDYLIINPHKEFIKGLAVVRHDFKEDLAYKIRMVRKHGNRYILTPVNPLHEEKEITPNEGTRFYVPIKVISMRDI